MKKGEKVGLYAAGGVLLLLAIQYIRLQIKKSDMIKHAKAGTPSATSGTGAPGSGSIVDAWPFSYTLKATDY